MAFSASLSGLNANQQKLNVIGNNLANINTVAFKASNVQFMDLVSQSTGGSSINPMQVGLGVVTGSMSPVFSQGAIESTAEATNAAIQGNGGTARLVMLPLEAHGYSAKESTEHTLYEMVNWFDKYVKNAKPR